MASLAEGRGGQLKGRFLFSQKICKVLKKQNGFIIRHPLEERLK